MSMELVYLASPYSHPEWSVRNARFRIVCKVAARLMADGIGIFCPIAHTHPIAEEGQLPTAFVFWEKYDRAMLAACSRMIVVMMDGWRESVGVRKEIQIMAEMGKAVEYIAP